MHDLVRNTAHQKACYLAKATAPHENHVCTLGLCQCDDLVGGIAFGDPCLDIMKTALSNACFGFPYDLVTNLSAKMITGLNFLGCDTLDSCKLLESLRYRFIGNDVDYKQFGVGHLGQVSR